MMHRWSDCEIPFGNPWPIDGDRRRYDPVSATIAGIGAGTSLFGGIFGKKSTSDATRDLRLAASTAGDKIVDTTQGQNNALSDITGGVNNSINAATNAGIGRVDTATGEANALLSPYRQSGEEANETLRKGLVAGGDFNRVATMQDIQLDPGYEFQRAEGQKIAEARAYAGGSGTSGAQQKALVRYNQNYANTGYQAAFERYQKQNQARYDNLFGVAGRGQTAATTSGQNLIEGGRYGSNLTVDAAKTTGNNTLRTGEVTSGRSIDAEAARQGLITDAASAGAQAKIAGDRSLINGITGAGNSVSDALRLRRSLQNPASQVNYLDPATTSRINSRLPAGVR